MALKSKINNLGNIGNLVMITAAMETVAKNLGGVPMSAVAEFVASWMADGSYDDDHACT